MIIVDFDWFLMIYMIVLVENKKQIDWTLIKYYNINQNTSEINVKLNLNWTWIGFNYLFTRVCHWFAIMKKLDLLITLNESVSRIMETGGRGWKRKWIFMTWKPKNSLSTKGRVHLLIISSIYKLTDDFPITWLHLQPSSKVFSSTGLISWKLLYESFSSLNNLLID